MARNFVGGGCLDIAGGTQKASWGNIFLTTDPITVAFLVKLRAYGSSNYDVIYGHSNASWFFILNGAVGSRGKLAFDFQSSGGEKTSGYLTNNLDLDTWYVVVGTHDSSGGADNTTLRVYTASDGVLVEEKTATNAFSISTTANSLVAGYDSVRTLAVDAQFKNFTIWNRVLTSGERDSFALHQSVSKASILSETLCNEGEGTTLRDTATSSNTYPATLSGSATTSSNIPSSFSTPRTAVTNRFILPETTQYSLNFIQASTHFVSVAQTAGLPIYSAAGYSITGWINHAIGAVANNSFYAEANTGNNVQAFALGTGSTGGVTKVRLFLRNDSNVAQLNSILSTTPILNGKWNHIVWTDNNGTCKLYINGVLDAQNFNYTPAGTYTFNSSGIGYIKRGTPVDHFNGRIKDVSVFNKVLSQTEVTEAYYKRSYPTTNLKGLWLFNEGSGTSVTDSSGNANTGTITGATYSSDVPFQKRTLIP